MYFLSTIPAKNEGIFSILAFYFHKLCTKLKNAHIDNKNEDDIDNSERIRKEFANQSIFCILKVAAVRFLYLQRNTLLSIK